MGWEKEKLKSAILEMLGDKLFLKDRGFFVNKGKLGLLFVLRAIYPKRNTVLPVAGLYSPLEWQRNLTYLL